MGITERREREKQRKRQDIIDAAERLFFSNGYNETTMDQVAEEAEFSKGALYLYFKNKEDLYVAINARGLKILSELFAHAITKGGNGLEQVQRIGEAYTRFFHEYHNYFDVMVTCETRIGAGEEQTQEMETEDAQYGQQAIALVAQAIQTGISDGSIREDIDPMSVAIILWGESTGILQLLHTKKHFLKENLGLDSDAILQLSMRLTHDALAKHLNPAKE